jgi:hypothetical protein
MKKYRFYFADGTTQEGEGLSGLNAWHLLGWSTFAWGMLHYAQEI